MKRLGSTVLILLLISVQVFSQKNIKPDKNLLIIKNGEVLRDFNQNPILTNPKSSYKINDYGDAPSWTRSIDFGGSASDFASRVAKDNNGNIIITGYFSGVISFESTTLTSEGIYDAFVAKFNPAGELIWFNQLPSLVNQRLMSYGLDIKDDNIYITGYYTGSVSIGNFSLPDKNDNNLFFAILDSNGNVTFANNYENMSDITGLTGINVQTDSENNIYILAQNPVNGIIYFRNPSQLLKFDQNGNILNTFTTDENISNFTLSESDIYFVGTIIDFGYIGDYYFDPSYNDVYVAKCNFDLNIEWAWMVEHTNYGYSSGLGIFTDENGNLIFSGFYHGDMKFGNISISGSTSFLVKLSDYNNFQWAVNIPLNNLDGYIIGNGSEVILSGYDPEINKLLKIDSYNGTIISDKTISENLSYGTIDNTSGNIYLTGSHNDLVFLSKTDSNLNEIWNFTFGGNSADGWVISTETDNNNNVYTYGYVSSEVNFSGQTIGKGNFLSKQKPDGQVLWIQSFPDISVRDDYGVFSALDTQNKYIYIAGNFNGIFTLPNGEEMVAGENGSVFILKFGLDGTFKDATKLDIPNRNQLCITVDQDENIILSGIFSGTINLNGNQLISYGGYDTFIIKLNMNMNIMWIKQAGGNDIEYSGLVSVDKDNNIYFTGEFCSETVNFGNNQITMKEGDGNILLSKIAPDGEVLWLKSTAGSPGPVGDYYCWPTGIVTSNDGSFYLKGWHGDSTYFDNNLLFSPYSPYSKFILKFNSSGDCIWANSINEYFYGFDYNKMDIDINDNVYFGMQVRDTVEFGDDFQYIPAGSGDLVFAKYLSDGTLDWVKTIQGEGYSWMTTISVFDSTTTVGGWFNNYITLGDSTFVTYNRHGFLTQCGKDYSGFNEVYNKNNSFLKIYPNPMFYGSTVEFVNNDNSSHTLRIFNTSGEIVREISDINSDKVFIEKGNLSKGTYTIEVLGRNRYFGKLLVE